MPKLHVMLQKQPFSRPILKVAMTKLANGVGNIGPSGRRQRLIFGLITLVAACALLLGTHQFGMNRWWRVGAFPLLWIGLVGILQARAATCIALASRGMCDLDAGARELTPEDADQLRQRARTIVRRATLVAVALIVLALVP
jgi:hypothetical protein